MVNYLDSPPSTSALTYKPDKEDSVLVVSIFQSIELSIVRIIYTHLPSRSHYSRSLDNINIGEMNPNAVHRKTINAG